MRRGIHTRRESFRTVRPVRRRRVAGRIRPAGEGDHVEEVREERSLRAILFVDMVGYTALVHEDESAAREARTLMRAAVSDRARTHGGEVVQHYGDGALCSFRSALEAVLAAREIRSELADGSGPTVRIGLHVADVVRDREGLFGDGVNVAARLQQLAAPGEILLSEAVARELQGHPDLDVRMLGRFRLKNLPEPMRVARLGAPAEPRGLRARLDALKRKGVRLHGLAAVLGSATAVQMAGASAVPEWALQGALVFALVELLGPMAGLRPVSG